MKEQKIIWYTECRGKASPKDPSTVGYRTRSFTKSEAETMRDHGCKLLAISAKKKAMSTCRCSVYKGLGDLSSTKGIGYIGEETFVPKSK